MMAKSTTKTGAPLRRHYQKTVGALAAIGLASSLTACVGTPAKEREDAQNAECPIEVNETSGSVRIGYLGSPGPDLYAFDQGLAESCLPNVKVDWTRFPTGQDIVQGFASDSVDLAGLGSTPTTKALSAPMNLDVVVPWVNSRLGESEALVAKHAKTVKELKGKKIAVPYSSTAHYSLLKALIAAGLDPKKDVEITNISPDKLPAAWNSNEIEATYVWDPTLSEVKESGHVLVTSQDVADLGDPTFNVTLASRGWTQDNNAVLQTWLDLMDYIVRYGEENPEQYAEINASAAGMDLEDTKSQLKGVTFVKGDQQAEYLDTVAGALRKTADFLVDQGDIPEAAPAEHYHEATHSTEAGPKSSTQAGTKSNQKHDQKNDKSEQNGGNHAAN